MTTELEQLARLVGNPDLEPIDSASMIEDSLRAALGGAISPDRVREMEEEIRNSGNAVETPQLKKMASGRIKTNQAEPSVQINASMEKVLLSLYDTRDGLVEAFETCNINSRTATILAGQINKLASCIRYMGGDIEEFEPLNHVSGLMAPNFYKNAQKVVETTIQCYSLGEVQDAKVLENGRKISIIFTGATDDVSYKAEGTITSDEWTGNEAIDYIYTPNEGKMSVKAFENGRWVDRSSSKKYKVVWNLEETDIVPSEPHAPNVHTLNETVEEENAQVMPNITPEDGEEDIGNIIR
jgi:hypothetical protein